MQGIKSPLFGPCLLMLLCGGIVLAQDFPAPQTTPPLDPAHYQAARSAIARGIEYLRARQNPNGSWSPQPGPAITGLVLAVLLDQPDISTDDPMVQRALAYILSKRQPDGGIHEGLLSNYNTAICLSALAHLAHRADLAPVIKSAQDYLRNLQWAGQTDPDGKLIDEKHPFYGGAGYGTSGRPDLSNTQIMLQALYDSGLDCNDPAFKRAIVFISRCQGTPSNTEYARHIVSDGGFIYATSESRNKIGIPQSQAGSIVMEDGTSRLATYGSMTYAGFKSYLYARLDRNDPRVQDAWRWIRRHYTVAYNPGMRDTPETPADERLQGYYYYLMTFAKALRAWGEPIVVTPDGHEHNWRAELIDQLVKLQHSDGSWVNSTSRWMEDDPNLATAYALTALTEALK